MARIDDILDMAQRHDCKMIQCSRCKGSGFVPVLHVEAGRCFKCVGKGKVPNKWLSIEQEAIMFRVWVARIADKIKEFQAIVDDDISSSFERKMAKRQVDSYKNVRPMMVHDLQKLIKRAGV